VIPSFWVATRVKKKKKSRGFSAWSLPVCGVRARVRGGKKQNRSNSQISLIYMAIGLSFVFAVLHMKS
jgi:hypothetical protein